MHKKRINSSRLQHELLSPDSTLFPSFALCFTLQISFHQACCLHLLSFNELVDLEVFPSCMVTRILRSSLNGVFLRNPDLNHSNTNQHGKFLLLLLRLHQRLHIIRSPMDQCRVLLRVRPFQDQGSTPRCGVSDTINSTSNNSTLILLHRCR